jgi:PAS domain S-box-containing protein
MADVDASPNIRVPPADGELNTAIVEAAPDALMVVDGEGRIVRANGRAESLFGYTRSELIGSSIELLMPETFRKEHEKQRKEFFLAARMRPMAAGRDLRARRKDGAELSVQVSLSPIHVAGAPLVVVAARETSEYYRHERASAERSRSMLRELETVLEAIPDPVAIRTGSTYAYVNSAFSRVLSYDSPSDLLGRTVLETVHPDDRNVVRKRLETPCNAQNLDAEIRLLAKDGTCVQLEFAPPVRIVYRGQPAFLVVAHDMRERKRLEAALSARDRMVTVGILAAGVGHEINNPLLFITMNLEFLAEEIRAIGKRARHARIDPALASIAEAQQGAERIRKIVRGLHTFARGEREEATELDVLSVLETSLSLTRNELRHHVRVVKNFHPVPHVYADESRLAQVFINLLVNAAHAMRQRPLEPNVITVSTSVGSRDTAVVEIRDNGPGMTSDVRTRVFEPFFTTKPIGEGTGLGLAIAYDIVVAAGGRITCESEPGAGTTFRIELPPHRHSLLPRETKAATPKPSRRGRVLVVDDDPVVAASLTRLLRADHDVDCAADGVEALAKLSAHASYDVVLCDVMMPRMAAAELYARVVRDQPTMASRFVFMTGATARLAAHAFLEGLPNPVLAKPFSVNELRTVVEYFVGDQEARPASQAARN